MQIPVKVTATPTGVATIKTTQMLVYNPNTSSYDPWITENGPIIDRLYKMQAAKQTLYFRATDSFNKTTQIPIIIKALNDGSQIASIHFPASMEPGVQYDVAVTLKNTGQTTWDPQTVSLASASTAHTSAWGDFSVPLTASVPPGETAVFNMTLTAPSKEGTFPFFMQLKESTRSPFGTIINRSVVVARIPPTVTMSAPATSSLDIPTDTKTKVLVQGSAVAGTNATISKLEVLEGSTVIATVNGSAIDQLLELPMGTHALRLRATDNWNETGLSPIATVTVRANDAAYVSQSVPATMQVGKAYTTTVTMRNSGNKPWTAAGGYALGSRNPENNKLWRDGRVPLTATVGASGQLSFSVPVTAPTVPGTYNFQWQMLQEGVEWFGPETPNVQVVVNPLAPTVPALAQPLAAQKFVAVGAKADVRLQGSATAGEGSFISKLEVLDGVTVIATVDGGAIDTVVQLAAGSHTLKLRATDNFAQVVTGTATTAITVLTNNASAVSRTAAASMVGGTTYQVVVVMHNAGTSTWTAEDGYALAPSPDNGTWVTDSIPVTGPVLPGANATFTFDVRAPADPATYPFQWQMVRNGTELFGAKSTVQNIVVTGVPPTVNLNGPANGSTYTAVNGSAQVPVAGTAAPTGSAVISKFEVLDGTRVAYTGSGRLLNATVPLTPGSHVLQLRATDSRNAVTLSQTSTVTVFHNDAAFVSQSVPTTMYAGDHYTVTLTVKNTGDTTWQPFSTQSQLGMALVEQPIGNMVWSKTGRVQLSSAVAPGATYTFSFDVIAPPIVKQYQFQWRMSDESKEFFGALSTPTTISVIAPPVPVVSLSASPVNQRVAPGKSASVTLTGSASEQNGQLSKLEVFADSGSGFGATALKTVNGNAAQLALNEAVALGNGSYRLKLRATDSGGHFADSAPVTVNVSDSPLLGQIVGVRSNGAQLQLVGWACRDTAAEALSYQVYVNAPPALGGAAVASGVANVGSEAGDAGVQAQCHTPGVSHYFAVDIASLQAQYPGAPLYVSAHSTHGETIVLPCEDHGCRLPEGLRIGLTSPNVNNLDRFRSPLPVFARAVVTGYTGTLDEVSFNINGEWLASTAEGAGAYSVSKAGLQASVAPYAAYAQVRQGETTLITDTHLFYVDPGIVPAAVLPKDGTIVPLSQPTVLSTIVNATVEQGQSVKFFIDPKAARAMLAGKQKMGGASPSPKFASSTTAASGGVVGEGTFDGTKWHYVWTPAGEGSYTIVVKLLDRAGKVLMETPAITLTVSSGSNPTDPKPVPVVVTPPSLPEQDAGSLPGNLGVDPAGAATYSIAVVVPPGTAGMQPNLALNYNSGGSNGIAGLGWALSGTSSIHRCGKTIAQDGVNQAISFGAGDRLCLDGQRLVRVNAPAPSDSTAASADTAYWTAGGEYRTEIESFSRVTAVNGQDGKLAFKVETKDGKTSYYGCDVGSSGCGSGATSNSYAAVKSGAIFQPDAPNGVADTAKVGMAISWNLSAIVDSAGNHIDFDYSNPDASTGEYLLKQIRYGGNFISGQLPYAAVRLTYEARSDAWTRYIADARNDLRNRLTTIETFVDTAGTIGDTTGTTVRSYTLAYDRSLTSGRSLLASVKVCATSSAIAATGQAAATSCQTATTFTWGKASADVARAFINRTPGLGYGGSTCDQGSTAPCLVVHGPVPGNAMGATTHIEYFDFSDFENNGRADILEKRVSDTNSGVSSQQQVVNDAFSNPAVPVGTLQKQYRYFHNTGYGFDHYQYKLNSEEYFAVLAVSDFNGDGYPDLLVYTASGPDTAHGGTTGAPKVCLSTLAGGLPAPGGTLVFDCNSGLAALGNYMTSGQPTVMDVIGDGRAAIYDAPTWSQTDGATDTLCIQGSCWPRLTNLPSALVNQNVPWYILDNRPSAKTYTVFEQAVDFSGTGKPEMVQWTIPMREPLCVGPDCGNCPVTSPDCFRWRNAVPQVLVSAFVPPGGVPPPALRFTATIPPPANGVPTFAPYAFDKAMNFGQLAGDFNGSGYSSLYFGLHVTGLDDAHSVVATRSRGMQCLSTGQHLDCSIRHALSNNTVSGANGYMKTLSVADFDGDGQPDLLMIQVDSKGIVVGDTLQMCHLLGDDSTKGAGPGDTNVSCEPWATPAITSDQLRAALRVEPASPTDQLYVMDVMGLGRPQLVYYHAGRYSGNVWTEDGRWEVLVPNDLATDGEALDRIVSVSNGYGSASSVTYFDGLTTGTISKSGTATLAYPQRLSAPTGKIVGKLRTGNGGLLSRITQYHYQDPATDLFGRGSLGFGIVQALDLDVHSISVTHYNQVWPNTGTVASTQVRHGTGNFNDLNGAVIFSTTNTPFNYSVTQANGSHTVCPLVGSTSVHRYDLDGSDFGAGDTVNEYGDGWCNLTRQTITLTPPNGNAAFVSETKTTYQPVGTGWFVGLPTLVRQTKTDPVSGSETRTVKYEYDAATGLLYKETIEPDEVKYRLTTSYDRSGNRFGLVNKKTQDWVDPACQGNTVTPSCKADKSRTLSDITYDSLGRFPATVLNALGHQEDHVNDTATGALVKLTDPNGLVTTWQVNGFGRVTNEKNVYDNETRRALKACAGGCPLSAAVMEMTETFHGKDRVSVPKVTYSDNVGHVLRTQTWGFDGRVIIADREYDGLGRLVVTQGPHFETDRTWEGSVQIYDDLDRVTQIYTSDESGTSHTSTIDYRGPVTVYTNARNHTRTETRNVANQLVEVEAMDTASNITKFGYEPFGALNYTEDPNKNVIKVQYDRLGRKLELRDPDLGVIQYRVDPLGQVWAQSTPNQRALSDPMMYMVYDLLGRMTARYEADLKSYWKFDTAPMGKGQLAEAYTTAGDTPDYDRIHTYDDKARPLKTTQVLDKGGYSFTSETSYDDWGRVVSQSYQRGGDTLKQFDQRYNGYGYLARVARGATVLWNVSSQDAANRATGIVLGNGLSQLKGFNPYTGRLDWATLTVPAGAAQLQEAYQYDVLGNVTNRTQYWGSADKLQGYSEDFTYDTLNRLWTSHIHDQPSLTFTYDAAGNMKSKTGTGIYTYPEQGALAVRPHAVQSIDSLQGTFAYDLNGNLLTSPGRSASWTSFDMPRQLAKGTVTSNFVYGPEHQRVRQERSDGSKVIYAGAQEVETKDGQVTVKTYWPMGIGFESENPDTGDTALNWVHRDRLDSVVAITGESGQLKESLAYDAWGKRRALTGNATPDGLDGVVDNKGYTGHEMLDQLDLVHMNGRVYDPFVGRFLSADRFIQTPYSGQNYNRYSYVLNNPTNLVDPTGFLVEVVVSGRAELEEAVRAIENARNMVSEARKLDAVSKTNAKNPVGKISFPKIASRVFVGLSLYLHSGDGVEDRCYRGDMCAIDPLTGELTHEAWAQRLLDAATARLEQLQEASSALSADSQTSEEKDKADKKESKKEKKRKWNKARRKHWKDRAANAEVGEFSPENLKRMEKGLAPKHDELGVSMELHHITPQSDGGTHDSTNLREVWPWEHADIDPYRYYKGPRP
ncbi:hypothetical protein RugamoR57_49320 [Duganella caerulea]